MSEIEEKLDGIQSDIIDIHNLFVDKLDSMIKILKKIEKNTRKKGE